jgi:ABC-type lipoprotein export system ATPase subunit
VTHDSRVASIASRVLTMTDGLISDETVLGEPRDSRESLRHVMRVEA